MSRITIKDLNAVCERLNRITGSPLVGYVKGEDGKYQSQVGNFHISRAYGGYSLYRMANKAGGVSDVFYSGHVPARDLYNQMHAFIRGIEFNKV